MSELPLSREVLAIQGYIQATGTPHKVTATLGRYLSPSNPCDPHSPGSYHCQPGTDGQGLAVDLAGPTASYNSPQLLAIFAAFGPVESKLAELIYSGAPYSIKDGRRVARYAVAAHFNHVHVAVPRGVFLPFPKPITVEVAPMYDPPHVLEPIVASLACPTGGAWLLAASGAIYAYGCRDWDAPNRHPEYWNIPGQKAARLEPFNGGYTVVDNAGRRYNYPAS